MKFEKKSNSVYLDMSLFDLSILDMLPKVVTDGSEGGVHLYTEVTPESYGSFIYRAFLLTKIKMTKLLCSFSSFLFDIFYKCRWK